MSLTTERPLYCGDHSAEGRGMGRVLESMEQCVTLLGGKVEFATATLGDID